MTLAIRYHDRELDFVFDGGAKVITGEGMEQLLATIKKYGTMVSRVTVEGDSPSYTFTRQVYLAANLLKFIKNKKGLEFPKYNNTFK